MWRHITGVKRPAETNNQQKDEDESKKSKRRRFNTKWTIGDNGKVREWLIYDRSTDEMYCSDCRMYGSEKAKSNPFVIGTKNLKYKKIWSKYCLRVIITYNDFVNNLTALKCVFLQVKE